MNRQVGAMDTYEARRARCILVWRLLAGVCLMALCGPVVWAADGNELHAIGAIQLGLGGAGVASPYDATWVLHNPASMVDLECRADFNFELIRIDVKAEPKGFSLAANPFAGEQRDIALIPIPSFAVVYPLARGTLGFGVFGMQGTMQEYAEPRTLLALWGNGDRRSNFELVRMPLAYAYRFDNGWAIGAAAVPVAARFRTDSITLRLAEAKGNHSWDYAAGFGVQLALYKRWAKWGLGANWSSRVWMDDFDKYKDDVLTSNFDMPQEIQAGVAYRPAPDWEILVDYKWIEWSETNMLGRRTVEGGLGWQNQHIGKLGVNHDINDRWSVRTGVSIGESPIQDEAIFANALTPGSARRHWGVGASYVINERMALHAAFSHTFPESRSDNGRGDIFSRLGRGTSIGYAEDEITLGYSLKF